jgi:hypothetical protein
METGEIEEIESLNPDREKEASENQGKNDILTGS